MLPFERFTLVQVAARLMHSRRRRNGEPVANLRLRRLTQAYLAPYEPYTEAQTSVVAKTDRVYSRGE